MDDTRSNLEAAARLVPGTMKIVEEAMTTSQHTDAAWQLGHELMQPMPPGWFRTMYETVSLGWQVTMVDHKNHMRSGWPERAKYEAQANNEALAVAHELCLEQAWQKHRKNTGV